MTKICVEPGCCLAQVTRSRCHEHWVELVTRECRASRKKRKPDRRVQMFMAARQARMDGDEARRQFILQHRRLPEEALPHGPKKGAMSLKGMVAERTFVSDITLDAGEDNWHGYEYFGDVSRDNWPELERYGLGGRDTSRVRKR